MKHAINLAKAFLAAGIVLEGGGRLAGFVPESVGSKLMFGTYDAKPIVAGGVALFGVITVASLVGGGKLASKVVPAA